MFGGKLSIYRGFTMPLYLDMHKLPGATPENLDQAHKADMAIQDQYGVRFIKYWWNRKTGRAFCLLKAETAEAAKNAHEHSHGMMPHHVIEVEEEFLSEVLDMNEAEPIGSALLESGEIVPLGAALLSEGSTPVLDGGIRTMLFTDLEGSTMMTNRIGDNAAMEILRTHNSVVRDALKKWNGREIKHTGDGIMASFVSTSGAVNCSIEIQDGFSKHNGGEHAEPINVRLGLSAGEPVEESDDMFGVTVQLAARICNEAQPGTILTSNIIPDLCMGKGLNFKDTGEFKLKGFAQPIRLFQVIHLDQLISLSNGKSFWQSLTSWLTKIGVFRA